MFERLLVSESLSVTHPHLLALLVGAFSQCCRKSEGNGFFTQQETQLWALKVWVQYVQSHLHLSKSGDQKKLKKNNPYSAYSLCDITHKCAQRYTLTP